MISVLLFVANAYAATNAAPVTVQLKGPANEAVGTATITAQDKGVKIAVDIKKLAPGEHAIHIHEKGVCTGPKFDSAGGHLAGNGKAHGEVPTGPHAGDMKNITVKPDGTLKTEFTNTSVTIEGLKAGTALVIHEKADDYKSQPAGNAGARVACGEIK